MLNKKSIIFLFVILAACGLVIFALYKEIHDSPVIAFYDVPPKQVSAIQTVLKESLPNIEKNFEWKTIPKEESLSSFLEKNTQTAFVFAYDQIGIFEAQNHFIQAEDSYFQQLPSTFLHNFFNTTEKNCYGFPLLINPVIMAYNTALFTQLHLDLPDSFQSFETTLKKLKTDERFPLTCAGGDDTQLFVMISAIHAMKYPNIHSNIFSTLRESQDLHSLSPEIKATLNILINWKKQGYIHPEWFRLMQSDISTFMQYGTTGIVFMPLSVNRQIDGEINNRFPAAQLPLPEKLSQKNMPADVLIFARTKESAKMKEADTIQKLLSKQTTNELLAKITGLAPVFSSALTQDTRATSARYWVAASNSVLPNFGNAAAYSNEEKAQLAKNIRTYLQVNGLGYE